MPLLEVTNLRTTFHTRNGIVRAVDDVSFHVEKGETLGIVGESGSGKSVTCYSLMGLIPQPPGRIESGTAMFDGTDLLHCSRKQLAAIRGKRIAMIFQDPMTSLNPYLRVGEQIIEPLMIHGRGQQGRRRPARPGRPEGSRHPRRPEPAARLSAPVQRGHAPARDDRHGADHQP